MSTDPSNGRPEPVDPTADPTADPTSYRSDIVNHPSDPTQHIDPSATTALPQAHSPAPTPAPFRVEPATPVPDDAVAPEWPPPAARAVHSHSADSGDPHGRPLVTVATRPRPAAVLFGLISLLVALYVILDNLTDLDLNLRTAGPAVFGGLGGLLVLVGLLGVAANRRRR